MFMHKRLNYAWIEPATSCAKGEYSETALNRSSMVMTSILLRLSWIDKIKQFSCTKLINPEG
jgi:hypothetical protein